MTPDESKPMAREFCFNVCLMADATAHALKPRLTKKRVLRLGRNKCAGWGRCARLDPEEVFFDFLVSELQNPLT